MYQLFAKQKVFKITDHYDIFNADQEAVYRVDQTFRLIGSTRQVRKLNSTLSFRIDKRVLSFLHKYDVTISDGSSFSLEQRFTFFNKKIDVISTDYQLTLVGDFLDFDFDVMNAGYRVGHIKRAFLTWGDTYVITVEDPRFELVLVALMIVVDEMIDMSQR